MRLRKLIEAFDFSDSTLDDGYNDNISNNIYLSKEVFIERLNQTIVKSDQQLQSIIELFPKIFKSYQDISGIDVAYIFCKAVYEYCEPLLKSGIIVYDLEDTAIYSTKCIDKYDIEMNRDFIRDIKDIMRRIYWGEYGEGSDWWIESFDEFMISKTYWFNILARKYLKNTEGIIIYDWCDIKYYNIDQLDRAKYEYPDIDFDKIIDEVK